MCRLTVCAAHAHTKGWPCRRRSRLLGWVCCVRVQWWPAMHPQGGGQLPRGCGWRCAALGVVLGCTPAQHRLPFGCMGKAALATPGCNGTVASFSGVPLRAHGVVVSHPLRMRKALGSNPSVSMLWPHHFADSPTFTAAG